VIKRVPYPLRRDLVAPFHVAMKTSECCEGDLGTKGRKERNEIGHVINVTYICLTFEVFRELRLQDVVRIVKHIHQLSAALLQREREIQP